MNSDNPVPSALTGALNNAARSSFACIDGRGMQCCIGGSIGVGESVWVQLCMHVALVDVGCIGMAAETPLLHLEDQHITSLTIDEMSGYVDFFTTPPSMPSVTEDVSYDDDDAEEDPDAAQRPQRARRAPRSYLSTTPRHGQKLRKK
ncbi:hypothetical protein V6N13_140346 [Hibiscus sabdariffa]